MEFSAPRLTLSILAMLVLVCAAETKRSNYLAFPRMGRSNYLAFPRMGRSQGNTLSDSCCGLGLKAEYVISPSGKEEELTAFCSSEEACCEGLTETTATRPNGVIYSVCVPESPLQAHHNSRVFETLKTLIRRK